MKIVLDSNEEDKKKNLILLQKHLDTLIFIQQRFIMQLNKIKMQLFGEMKKFFIWKKRFTPEMFVIQ